MRAPRGGIETYWQVFGGGPRPALFIHCGMAHSGAWRGVAEALSDLATVTAFDMAGQQVKLQRVKGASRRRRTQSFAVADPLCSP